TIVSVVTLVWGISPRQPSGKNIIRWLLKKRTNGSVRYCQYTSHLYRFISFAWRVIFSDGSPALFQPEFVGIPGDRSVQTVH
ncbi:hypothetical protein L1057_26325, partial [Escherichia coli]|uniref:hypothetical protein n=1 Tax=Escherichia coli TaxID=562 RepID=UPI00237B7ABF